MATAKKQDKSQEDDIFPEIPADLVLNERKVFDKNEHFCYFKGRNKAFRLRSDD